MTILNGNLMDNIHALRSRIQNLESELRELNPRMKRIAEFEVKKKSKIILQAETYFGLYLALCVDTLDPKKQGRVRIYSPLLNSPDTPVKALEWARPISTLGGIDDCGAVWVPPASSMLCVIFERGSRSIPYYIGTTWSKDRGPDGAHIFNYPMPEYDCVYEGHRKGYLVGPNDGSQIFPSWNTESYNGPDPDNEATGVPAEDVPIHVPNIYGMKTPEKHMWKAVDGDPYCNRRWKRLEMLSGGGGGWMIFKDDHMHPSGQWAHPNCGNGGSDVSNCATCDDAFDTCCTANEKLTCGPGDQSVFGNPWFKHENECRPYKGPGTPQNNKADLPQTGIQFLSYGGHTFLMDDKVEQPQGIPNWERSTQDFDWGCTDKCEGRTHWTSMTGHFIEMSDWEETPKIRSEYNHLKLSSACGNQIKLCDHTVSAGVAGAKRGIWLTSTSNHVIQMCDEGTEHESVRKEINPETSNTQGFEPGKREPRPKNTAKKGFIRLRTGYGLEIMMSDEDSQEMPVQQYVQIFCPQESNVAGPHLHRYQTSLDENKSYVYLRVGGDYICSTYNDHLTLVGQDINGEELPANKVVLVSKDYVEVTENVYYNKAKLHMLFADEKIFLLAGEDCPGTGDNPNGPCIGYVAVYTPTGLMASTRIMASYNPSDPVIPIFGLAPFMNGAGAGANNIANNANQ